MARVRSGWLRWRSWIRFQHVAMLLLAASSILFSILLAGCTTEGLSDLYLLSLSYTGSASSAADNTITNPNVSSAVAGLAGTGSALQVRVGYFGYCLIHGAIKSCSSDADLLAASLRGMDWSDPLNMLFVAKSFRNDTIFSGLIFISIILGIFCFGLLSTFRRRTELQVGSDGESEHERLEVRPFPSRRVSQSALILVLVASIFALVAALWQHLSSAATSTMAGTVMYGTVSGQVGAGAMALGWVGTALLIVVAVGLLLKILSMRVLELINQVP
ncbi:hypothetical protein N657DRAFT_483905 [Parathielavia appendiculata]|uniref:Uncharacterized protein n=1 Tax=Parathielavia appendiculata TaxID=2587402 RepID=A0AAN6Z3N3_9PEZI|nr:hypothetical protein N657DRAFT_483905 [Parathielavia appendiculata]